MYSEGGDIQTENCQNESRMNVLNINGCLSEGGETIITDNITN